ncbi:MAG: phosphoglycerate mutase [Candidatus Binatia bacterium]|nr:MAG: phosphoglycerate mutase [Candidatus Binatia bacterium]
MARLHTLLFLRHGETTGQSSTRYWGSTDVPLSCLGQQQMRCAAAVVAPFNVCIVYTSTLSRTRDAAALVAPNVPSEAVAAFDEVHFGAWEGMTEAEIAASHPDEYVRWKARTDDFVYPGGESLNAFRARVAEGLARVLDGPGPTALILSHRGVIVRSLSLLLGWERPRLTVALGSLHVIQREGGSWQPVVLDRTDHLTSVSPTSDLVTAVDHPLKGKRSG